MRSMSNRALNVEQLSQCTKCIGLGKDHVPAIGNPAAEVVIVGQSPGVAEVEEGRPFVGPSGEVLDFMLDEAGLTRDMVYITNVLKCHPPGNRLGHPEELDLCFEHWLKKELKFVNPRIVVLVGKDAWKQVTQGKIEWGHGKVTKGKKRTFLVVYHPAYFLRQGDPSPFVTIGKKLKELYNEPRTS